jgi:hypothetical protein
MGRGLADASPDDGPAPINMKEFTLEFGDRPSNLQKFHSQPPINMVMLRNALGHDDRCLGPILKPIAAFDLNP